MDRSNGELPPSLITVLVAPADLASGRLALSGENYRHLFRARRVANGDRLRLVDGQGTARWGVVDGVDRRRAGVVVGEPAPHHEAERRVELLVPLPRGSRASWLIEKATEVGASAVRWLGSERGPRDLGESTLERHRRVARAALEQCHRARLPEVSGPHPWATLPALLEGAAERVVLDPRAVDSSGDPPAASSVAVIVGPEGGWTGAELRIETAAILGAFWALGAR
jgi:16S rRNA (uracil1498-N3)-methyltransferase